MFIGISTITSDAAEPNHYIAQPQPRISRMLSLGSLGCSASDPSDELECIYVFEHFQGIRGLDDRCSDSTPRRQNLLY